MEIIKKGLKKFSQVCIGEVFCFVSNADYTYCPLLYLGGGVVDLDDNYFIPESRFPLLFFETMVRRDTSNFQKIQIFQTIPCDLPSPLSHIATHLSSTFFCTVPHPTLVKPLTPPYFCSAAPMSNFKGAASWTTSCERAALCELQDLRYYASCDKLYFLKNNFFEKQILTFLKFYDIIFIEKIKKEIY